MAANIISVANVAGKNNVVYSSAVTMGFPCNGIIVTTLPSTITIGSTACETSIKLIATGDVYYTSTTVGTIYTTSVYTGSAKYSFTSTIAAINGNALASPQVIGLPSLGVIVEPISSTTYGTTACVTKITELASNTVYFTADTVATLIGLT